MSRVSFDSISNIGRTSFSSYLSKRTSIFNEDVGLYKSNESDDRNWSRNHLRKKFDHNRIESTYALYVRRLRSSFYNVYLLAHMLFSVLYSAILLVAYRMHPQISESRCSASDLVCAEESFLLLATPELLTHGIIFFISLLVYCIVSNENLFEKKPRSQIIASCFTCLMMITAELSLSLFFILRYEQRRTSLALHIIIVIFYFLPLPDETLNALMSGATSLLFFVFNSTLFWLNADERDWKQIPGLFIFYLCANVVGYYSQMLIEITVRRAFMDRRNYIKNTHQKAYEKDREDQLLQSILPRHISSKVKQEIRNEIKLLEEMTSQSEYNQSKRSSTGTNGPQKKPFSDLFLERYDNVTILYADIVNFTPLTVKLKPEDLVEMLNRLFGRFDEAAEAHDCLRIKLLGDCYYCVSGVPNQTPNHAKNCVELGFDMLEIIKDVRETYNEDVNMRIGIHTGTILCGILGTCKWQYDIWSVDVTIANHMEASGRAGRIHISKQTKEALGNEYSYKEDYARRRDKFLNENKIDTFLIENLQDKIEEEEYDEEEAFPNNTLANGHALGDSMESAPRFKYSRSASVGALYNSKKRVSLAGPKSAENIIKRKSIARSNRRTFGEEAASELKVFQDMMRQVNEKLEKVIHEMPITIYDRWFGKKSHFLNSTESIKLNPLTLCFNNLELENQFHRQSDPLFRSYVILSLWVLLSIGAIQMIIIYQKDHFSLWLSFGCMLSLIMVLIPSTWVNHVWMNFVDPHKELDIIPDPKNKIIRFFFKTSNFIRDNWKIRNFLFLVICGGLSTFAIIDVIECDPKGSKNLKEECNTPWYFTFSCALAILAIFSFFRVSYVLKFLLSLSALSGYFYAIFFFRTYVFDRRNGISPALLAIDAEVYSHLIYLVSLTVLLLIMDRQMEYITRLDFIWNKQLIEEHKEAVLTQAVNTSLIKNILPARIAKIYLDPKRSGESQSRTYQNVSVMFASIPNYMDFYSENEFNKHGANCLLFLNTIITEFDETIFRYKDVEKIKVIGSTYMSACGLGVREASTRAASGSLMFYEDESKLENTEFPLWQLNDDNETSNDEDRIVRSNTLLTLAKCAAEMNKHLNKINEASFQDFHLRIGISTGMVVAGVIGARKPYFDIFGDTVNLASRMDSTGVPGKIQTSEYCAKLLMQKGVSCTNRGITRVKGKGTMNTYFVNLTPDFTLKGLQQQDSTDL